MRSRIEPSLRSGGTGPLFFRGQGKRDPGQVVVAQAPAEVRFARPPRPRRLAQAPQRRRHDFDGRTDDAGRAAKRRKAAAKVDLPAAQLVRTDAGRAAHRAGQDGRRLQPSRGRGVNDVHGVAAAALPTSRRLHRRRLAHQAEGHGGRQVRAEDVPGLVRVNVRRLKVEPPQEQAESCFLHRSPNASNISAPCPRTRPGGSSGRRNWGRPRRTTPSRRGGRSAPRSRGGT
jgi:hypothetical protein